MCKLPNSPQDCESCQTVETTFGSLKQAQNEAFQDGMSYFMRKLIQINNEAQTFEPMLFEAVVRAQAIIFANVQPYDEPECDCSSEPECDCHE